MSVQTYSDKCLVQTYSARRCFPSRCLSKSASILWMWGIILLKVLLSDWLLVEPLILLFTMTFMNTVTKWGNTFSNSWKPWDPTPLIVRQEVYLGKVQMLHPDLSPDALQDRTSRWLWKKTWKGLHEIEKNHTRAYNMWNSKFFPRFISWVAALETGLTLPILLISGPLSDKYGRKGGKLEGVNHHQCCHQGLLWSLLLAGVLANGVFALLVFLDKRGADLPLFYYLAPIYGSYI